MKSLYHGGHGPLLRIIGGRIGMVDILVEHTAVVVHTAVTHIPKAHHITKDLGTLLIKSRDHGVAQVVMRMRARHQKDMVDIVMGMLVAGMLAEGMLAEDTANQCGG